MNTSYYSSKKLNINQNLVAISLSQPKSILKSLPNIRVYRSLCPDWQLVQDFKFGKIDKDGYISHYYSTRLEFLDPARVYQELGENAILLCWEGPTKFCHRHIVAKWFEDNLGVRIVEL